MNMQFARATLRAKELAIHPHSVTFTPA